MTADAQTEDQGVSAEIRRDLAAPEPRGNEWVTGAAISAADAPLLARCAVVADDGSTITLTLYGIDQAMRLDVPPHLAIGIAGDLILAARRRFGQSIATPSEDAR